MSAGFIYVLSNPAMPDLLKIGRTNRSVEERVRELHSTGVPSPFVIEFSVFTDNSALTEGTIHNALQAQGFRASANREFFRISVGDAISSIRSLVGLDNDLERAQSLEQWHELKRVHDLLPHVEYGLTLSEIEVQRVDNQLSRLGRAGYAYAFKTLANIYENNHKSALKSRESWQNFLTARLEELNRFFAAPSSDNIKSRGEFGKQIAEYLMEAHRSRWIMDVDFQFVSDLLVDGDRCIYQGYIDHIARSGLPAPLLELAKDA